MSLNNPFDYYRILPINWALKHQNADYRIQPCVECGEQFARDKRDRTRIRCDGHSRNLLRRFMIQDDDH